MSHKPFGNIDMVLVGHGLYTADVIAIMIWLKRIYGPDLNFDFVSIAPESNKEGLILIPPKICNRNVLLLGVLQSFVTDPPTHLVKRTAVDFVRLLSLGQNRIVGIIDTEPKGFFWDHALEGGVDLKELSVYPIGLGTAYSTSCRILPTAYSAELVPRYLASGTLSCYPKLIDRCLSLREIIYKVLASCEDTFCAVRCRYLVSHFSESWEPDDQIQKWLEENRTQKREVLIAIKQAEELRPGIFKLVQPMPLTNATDTLLPSFLERKGEEAVKVMILIIPGCCAYIYININVKVSGFRRLFKEIGVKYAIVDADLELREYCSRAYVVLLDRVEAVIDGIIDMFNVAH